MASSSPPAPDTPARWLHDSLGGYQGLHAPQLSTSSRLAAIRLLRARLDEEEQQLAFEAKIKGKTWKQIASIWGLGSPQRAQQMFGEIAGLVDRLPPAPRR